MCGIAGSFRPKGPVALLDRGKEVASRLAHRGPDASGVWQSPNGQAQLVHTRLSIIDVGHRSDQPLVRKRTVTVFNGEVYNFRQLRRELRSLGRHFATEGDTEVIAHGFEQWGIGVFQRLRGMYAIGIYEPQAARLTLARDLFGIKPLVYGVWGDELRFGSEAKALLIDQAPKLNEPILWDLATFGFHFEHQSIWERIVHLPPGGVLEVSRGPAGLHLALHQAKQLDSLPAEAGGQSLMTVLAESVRDHLIADVPVALALSGGLDSSIVTALAHRQSPGISAYTNSFAVANDPEVRHASLLCEANHIPHFVIASRVNDAVELLDRICWHLEEPVPNIALITSFFLGRALADQGYKVVLIGEGADELLAGYPWHALALTRTQDISGRELFRAYANRRSQQQLAPWLRPAAAARLQARVADQERAFLARFSEARGTTLAKFLAFDQRFQLEFSQLLRVDRLLMAHGVEARVPYLYDPVAAITQALPDEGKMQLPPYGLLARWLRHPPSDKVELRRVASQLAPPSIAARPKFGKQGTANLHKSAAAQAVEAYFQSALASEWHSAARAALDDLFDWPRIAAAESPLPGKLRLFLGLLLGTTAHALNAFQWTGGDAHRWSYETAVQSLHPVQRSAQQWRRAA